MTKYSDIEIQTANNLLKEGYKWIARNGSGRLFTYYEKPVKADTGWYSIWYPSEIGGYVCKELVPIFQGIRSTDKEPVSLESIVHPQILDDAEKRYMKGVIRPFRDNVKSISKGYTRLIDKEFIIIYFKDGEKSALPYFETGTMYKGMERNKNYSSKDLGL